MKRIILIFIILVLSQRVIAENYFKEGNKLYLQGKYKEALEKYKQFIQNHKDYYEGYYNAGNAYFRLEMYENALDMYKKALKLKPDDEDIKHNIRVTEEKLKEKRNKKNNKNKNQNSKSSNMQNSSKENSNNDNFKNKKQQQNKENKGQNSKRGNNKLSQNKNSANKNNTKKFNLNDDEVQALLNMMQKQEKQYRRYFGRQYRKKHRDEFDFPDFFNMSPEEIMRYMEREMMNPFSEPESKSGGDKKDW